MFLFAQQVSDAEALFGDVRAAIGGWIVPGLLLVLVVLTIFLLWPTIVACVAAVWNRVSGKTATVVLPDLSLAAVIAEIQPRIAALDAALAALGVSAVDRASQIESYVAKAIADHKASIAAAVASPAVASPAVAAGTAAAKPPEAATAASA